MLGAENDVIVWTTRLDVEGEAEGVHGTSPRNQCNSVYQLAVPLAEKDGAVLK
jgi:hypothetical protein